MSQPLVSVIVPTYNVKNYIDECLDSILSQTYKNIEIIVIDDGSTDDTPQILKRYAERVHLMLCDKNQGQGAARNLGISQAAGEHILFVDADDWIERETVELLVKRTEESSLDLVRFNAVTFIDGKMEVIKQNEYDFSSLLNEKKVYVGAESLLSNQKSYSASPCLYFVKKKVLSDNNILFPEHMLHEDEYFTTMVFLHVRTMGYLNKGLYHRRYRPDSTMTTATPEQYKRSFESYLKIFKLLEKEYGSLKYDQWQQKFIKRQLLSIYNGLQQSLADSSTKRSIRTLNSITIKDKLYLFLSKVKAKYRF